MFSSARFGTISRNLWKVGSSKAFPASRIKNCHPLRVIGGQCVYKSTQAIDDLYEDELDYRSRGHASAASYRVGKTQEVLQDHPWMINLNRGNDNEWLSKPRVDNEWYTGLAPHDCPGKCATWSHR